MVPSATPEVGANAAAAASVTAPSSSHRGSWKSRLMGGGGGGSSNNTSNNNSIRRRSASPSMRRFSHSSKSDTNFSSTGDEKKEDADLHLVTAMSPPAMTNTKPEMTRSLSASREQRSQKTKGVRGRLRQLLPKSHHHTNNIGSSAAKSKTSSDTNYNHGRSDSQPSSFSQHPSDQQKQGSAGGLLRRYSGSKKRQPEQRKNSHHVDTTKTPSSLITPLAANHKSSNSNRKVRHCSSLSCQGLSCWLLESGRSLPEEDALSY